MQEVSFFWKVITALCAGIFGVAVAISIQHIKLSRVPKLLVFTAIIVQLLLSWGVFIFVMIFFQSGLLPQAIPNDDFSALSVAYFTASIPHIVITTAILIYNKEVNRWLESRYGQGEQLPSMDKMTVTTDVEEAYKQSTKIEDLAEKEREPKVCESCGQEVCEHR